MKQLIPLFALIALSPVQVVAQTQTAPPPNTTIVLPENGSAASTATSTTATPGYTETTVTSVKREDGSATTVVTQQPQSTYQPLGSRRIQSDGAREHGAGRDGGEAVGSRRLGIAAKLW
jgi:hypothetical protein